MASIKNRALYNKVLAGVNIQKNSGEFHLFLFITYYSKFSILVAIKKRNVRWENEHTLHYE